MTPSKKAPRSAQRALAFQVLYSLTFTDRETLDDVAKAFRDAPEQNSQNQGQNTQSQNSQAEPEGFAWELVKGVWENQTALDTRLTALSQNWRIERMGKVEITLLRLALYEILFRRDIPPKVAINEAIELSKQFGDDGSRGFVNGILDAAAKALETGALKP
ncbi:MAG: Transcription antitermination protein NusB [Desulfovibrio sp.]